MDSRSSSGIGRGYELSVSDQNDPLLDLPSAIQASVAERVLQVFDAEELSLPYIPERFGPQLVAINETNFGMEYLPPFDPREFYLFDPVVRDLIEGNFVERVQFGLDGSGLNSYAWTYLLVTDGLAFIGQAHRGDIYWDPAATALEWVGLMRAARIVEITSESHIPPEGKRLLIVWSPMRGLVGRRWIADSDPAALDVGDLSELDDDERDLDVFLARVLAEYALEADPLEAEVPDPQIIYDRLASAGLVDLQGTDSQERFFLNAVVEVEGKRYDSSRFSGDDIDMYFLRVEVWDLAALPARAGLLRDKYFNDPNCLVAILGPYWSVVLIRGAKDAEIPKDIVAKLLDALPDGQLAWEREIPEAEWFVSAFETASAILNALMDAGLTVTPSDPTKAVGMSEASEYIYDVIPADLFATASMALPGLQVGMPITLHVFIEEHWARSNVVWLESYLPFDGQQIYVVGDGWVVRIIGDQAGIWTLEKLRSLASVVLAALDGVAVIE
jgi:hypothetical protein